jgi:hypothetical protein
MGDRLYGVADAARDKELAFAAPRRFGQTIRWLFEEGSGAHMQDVAPYLVPIAFKTRYPYEGSGYLDLWAAKLGTSAGILLSAPADPDSLREHLDGVFRVTDETEHRYYFRFYDPRVLRAYLPTCTLAEAREFFGPVSRFLAESERPGRMVSYRPGRSGVQGQEESLRPPSKSPSLRKGKLKEIGR